jgi:hypothetical protein
MNESNPGVNAWHVIVRLFSNYWIRMMWRRKNDIINKIYNIIINYIGDYRKFSTLIGCRWGDYNAMIT